MTQITIAYGDGIGPEIMEATMLIMREAGAAFEIEMLLMGEEEYRLGAPNGFDNRTLRSIKRAGVLLKAPTIDPALIPELTEEEAEMIPVSKALYNQLELTTHETAYIHTDGIGFTAISSIGEQVAVFESALAHDSIANPVGMILASLKMLEYLGYAEITTRIESAVLKTLNAGENPENCGKFADAVVENLNLV